MFWLFPSEGGAGATAEFIPESVQQGLIKNYQGEELQAIKDENEYLLTRHLKGKTPKKPPLYIGTAGGPGASKTTILEGLIADKRADLVYADPDHSVLKYMHGYINSRSNLALSKSPLEEVSRAAYTKWRGASNWIANNIINSAFEQGLSIAHGTTSSAPQVENLYQKLKAKGYKIELILCGSTDQNRKAALEHREKEQKLYQPTFENYVAKGKTFYDRLPVYFKYADVLHLYWTDRFSHESTHVATFNGTQGLTIHDEKGYQAFIKEYETHKNEGLPAFDALIQTS